MKIYESELFKQHKRGPRALRVIKRAHMIDLVCYALGVMSALVAILSAAFKLLGPEDPGFLTFLGWWGGVIVAVSSGIVWMINGPYKDQVVSKVEGRVQQLAFQLGMPVEHLLTCDTSSIGTTGEITLLDRGIQVLRAEEELQANITSNEALADLTDKEIGFYDLRDLLIEFHLRDRSVEGRVMQTALKLVASERAASDR